VLLNQCFYSPGCIQCGSFLIEASLFCPPCFKKHLIPRIENSFCVNPDRHVFLMEWPRTDEMMFDQLVYRLKASQSPQAIDFYSDLLAEKLVQLKKPGAFEALIPVPGSSQSRIHSQRIAQRLSQQIGLKALSVLEKIPSSNQQKILSSFERRKLNPFRMKASLPEEFTNVDAKHGPVHLVDDVLATSQSIKNAEGLSICIKPNAVATHLYRTPLLY